MITKIIVAVLIVVILLVLSIFYVLSNTSISYHNTIYNGNTDKNVVIAELDTVIIYYSPKLEQMYLYNTSNDDIAVDYTYHGNVDDNTYDYTTANLTLKGKSELYLSDDGNYYAKYTIGSRNDKLIFEDLTVHLPNFDWGCNFNVQNMDNNSTRIFLKCDKTRVPHETLPKKSTTKTQS